MIAEVLQWFYDGVVAVPLWLQTIIGIFFIIYFIIAFDDGQYND